jgi:hypothetical protein
LFDDAAKLDAMAAEIIEHRAALARLARAIRYAEAGVPFGLVGPGPSWRPRPGRAVVESIDDVARAR